MSNKSCVCMCSTSSAHLISQCPRHDDDVISEFLGGNLCVYLISPGLSSLMRAIGMTHLPYVAVGVTIRKTAFKSHYSTRQKWACNRAINDTSP